MSTSGIKYLTISEGGSFNEDLSLNGKLLVSIQAQRRHGAKDEAWVHIFKQMFVDG